MPAETTTDRVWGPVRVEYDRWYNGPVKTRGRVIAYSRTATCEVCDRRGERIHRDSEGLPVDERGWPMCAVAGVDYSCESCSGTGVVTERMTRARWWEIVKLGIHSLVLAIDGGLTARHVVAVVTPDEATLALAVAEHLMGGEG